MIPGTGLLFFPEKKILDNMQTPIYDRNSYNYSEKLADS